MYERVILAYMTGMPKRGKAMKRKASARSATFAAYTMTRKRASLRFSLALLVGSTLVSATAAAGVIYQLDATSTVQGPNLSVSDFWVLFDDLDGDSLFSEDELLSFSGMTRTTSGSTFYDLISAAPMLTGVADGNNNPSDRWLFAKTGGGTLNDFATNWTYEVIEAPPTAAPLPGTVALFGLGLVGLGLGRRRLRAHAQSV
ncbi:MAG: hypothetical protein ACI87W_002248 [Halieaceae bacterium]|jgi:hypothetical protein